MFWASARLRVASNRNRPTLPTHTQILMPGSSLMCLTAQVRVHIMHRSSRVQDRAVHQRIKALVQAHGSCRSHSVVDLLLANGADVHAPTFRADTLGNSISSHNDGLANTQAGSTDQAGGQVQTPKSPNQSLADTSNGTRRVDPKVLLQWDCGCQSRSSWRAVSV